MTTIIYKGIEIECGNHYYVFYMHGLKYINSNIHMAKRMVTKALKNNPLGSN